MTNVPFRTTFRCLISLALCLAPACGGDGGGHEPTAITERPSRALYACRVARDITDHSPLLWDPWPVMTAAPGVGGGTAFLGRLESMSETPFDPSVVRKLLVSTFGADGNVGPSIPLSGVDGKRTIAPALAPHGDGFAVAWVADDDSVRLGAFDRSGQPTLAATSVEAGLGGRVLLGQMRLAAGADGSFALAYSSMVDLASPELRLLVIGPDGARRGPPRVLAVGGGVIDGIAVEVAAAADGYGLVWVDPTAPRGRVVFSKVDATGAEIIAPEPISVTQGPRLSVGGGGFGFAPGNVALLAVDGGYLAGWNEQSEADDGYHGAWVVTRLVRLDAAGIRQGIPAALRAPVADVDEVDPSLLAFADGAVAVLWSRGSHIYLCSGCVPDHRIDMVLVDPVELVPLGNVVSVLPGDRPGAGTRPGGLLNRGAAVVGSSVVTAFNVTFHTSHLSASAAFACE